MTQTIVLLVLLCAAFAQQDAPDPTCSRGISAGSACCAAQCGQCGGSGCGSRPGGGAQCCMSGVIGGNRGCNEVGPPCEIGSGSAGGSSNSGNNNDNNNNNNNSNMSGGNGSGGGGKTRARWVNIDGSTTGRPQARHEACFVMVEGKGYLIGGRGTRDVSIFNAETRTWQRGPAMPTQMHHMQCVRYGGNIYIPASWFGGFPREENNPDMWILNTRTLKWSKRPGLPKGRLRGSAAAVVYNNRIYVVCGNDGGHGPPAKSLGWMDYYDLKQNKWVTNLPTMPDARDHVGGAIVKGMLCIAGGRDGGASSFFSAVKTATYCFNFQQNKWMNMNAPIPAGRAGAATDRVCGGKMMVAGGEGAFSAAFTRVDLFDGSKWTSGGELVRGRHGTGLGVSRCECGQVFIASGSGMRGGSPELDSTEVYLPNGRDQRCAKY